MACATIHHGQPPVAGLRELRRAARQRIGERQGDEVGPQPGGTSGYESKPLLARCTRWAAVP